MFSIQHAAAALNCIRVITAGTLLLLVRIGDLDPGHFLVTARCRVRDYRLPSKRTAAFCLHPIIEGRRPVSFQARIQKKKRFSNPRTLFLVLRRTRPLSCGVPPSDLHARTVLRERCAHVGKASPSPSMGGGRVPLSTHSRGVRFVSFHRGVPACLVTITLSMTRRSAMIRHAYSALRMYINLAILSLYEYRIAISAAGLDRSRDRPLGM